MQGHRGSPKKTSNPGIPEFPERPIPPPSQYFVLLPAITMFWEQRIYVVQSAM